MKKINVNLLRAGAAAIILLLFSSYRGSDCNYEKLYEDGMKKLKKFTLMKDYQVYMKKSKKKDGPEFLKQTITLNRGVRYKFYAVKNDAFDGVPVVTIYNNEKMEFLLATTYNPAIKHFFEVIEFECKTTGNYCLTFSFLEGKEGCALGISSYMK